MWPRPEQAIRPYERRNVWFGADSDIAPLLPDDRSNSKNDMQGEMAATKDDASQRGRGLRSSHIGTCQLAMPRVSIL